MSDQTTDHLVGAVEALADLQSLGEGERKRYHDDLLHEVKTLEPFFATYYEDKGRSEERERLMDVDGPVLLTIREVVGTEAEAMGFRDEEGEGVWANHSAVEALGDAVSDAVHRKLAALDSDEEKG